MLNDLPQIYVISFVISYLYNFTRRILSRSTELFRRVISLIHGQGGDHPPSTNPLYNICTTSAQRLRRRSKIVQICCTNVLYLQGKEFNTFILITAQRIETVPLLSGSGPAVFKWPLI